VVVASGLSLLPDRVDTHQSFIGQGLAGIPGALSTVVFSCGDHVCFPDIYNAAGRNSKTYKKGMCFGFGIFATCLLAFCVPAYLTFGTAILPNVLRNISLDTEGNASGFPLWMRSATNFVLAIRFLFIIPCFMPVIFSALDSLVGICFRTDLSIAARHETIFAMLPQSPYKFAIALVCESFHICASLVVRLSLKVYLEHW